jgi:hypothetical protein
VVHVRETVSSKTVVARMDRSPKWFARIPARVLLDEEIDSTAVRAFGVLSLNVYQGNVSSIGIRLLAKLLRVSHQTAMRKLRMLEARGHITVEKSGPGLRSFYVLNSAIFGQKQRDGVTEVARGPSGGKRFVSYRKGGA